MPNVRRRATLYLGILSIAIGVAFNKWLLGSAIAADGNIDGPEFLAMIATFQAAAIILGVYFVVRRPPLELRLDIQRGARPSLLLQAFP